MLVKVVPLQRGDDLLFTEAYMLDYLFPPKSIIDFYGDNVDGFLGLGGPGGWNDPDMLVIGDGNSLEESELGF